MKEKELKEEKKDETFIYKYMYVHVYSSMTDRQTDNWTPCQFIFFRGNLDKIVLQSYATQEQR